MFKYQYSKQYSRFILGRSEKKVAIKFEYQSNMKEYKCSAGWDINRDEYGWWNLWDKDTPGI